MIKSEPIYKRDSTGKLRVWSYEVDGDKYRTIAGVKGGSLVTSKWTVCKPKSRDTAEEQAAFEAQAEENKKLDREYRRTIEELDAVPQSPMLAKKYEDEQKRVDNCFANGFNVYSQPKLDGIRATTSRHGAFSREYQRHLNVDHILEALTPVFAKNPDLVFDGELYNHDLKADFNKITSIVRKQNPTSEQRDEARRLIQYHVYDLANSDGKFAERSLDLSLIFVDFDLAKGPVKFVRTDRVADYDTLDALNGEYIEWGYEGQMVRLNAPYEFDKRSKFLLKRKEFLTDEFKLLRVEEGQGNWAGLAKRIVFQLPDGRECGAGMRGDQTYARNLLLASKGYDDRAQVTIRYFTPTPDGMPRFPVAIDVHPEGRRD